MAVSGGSDSLGLLYRLSQTAGPARLVALTVDHGLREGSAEEARHVKSLSRRLGLRHETLVWKSDKPATGVQAAARAARYRLMSNAASRMGLAAVLTAHTADDQMETLWMRRARRPKESSAGLAGISPATLFEGRMWVLRPWLGIDRAAIRSDLAASGMSWIEDPSNRDVRFERVRARQALAERGMADMHTARKAAARRTLLARQAGALVQKHFRPGSDHSLHITLDLQQPPQAVLLALEAAIGLCGGAARPLDRRGKAALEELIYGNRARQSVTLGRALLRRKGTELTIMRERRGLDRSTIVPGACDDWDGRFRIRNLDHRLPLTVFADAAHPGVPLFSRDFGASSPIWRLEDGVAGGFVAGALAGRYARILPVYETPLGQALADTVGAAAFPPCPWTNALAFGGQAP
ncbi:tRNA lysidine(34) synthetase TilS [uncultured Hoeflea sp.]|uniref:tRNA lysidine(34) synthetase TilS n=1 Tax=uncultured Hoeflea sp. TaxID=538666 RepID=UPI002629FE5E|nr:tRNA lysidine(34) synthetase TilS [uncultured Hoeflea sp.]